MFSLFLVILSSLFHSCGCVCCVWMVRFDSFTMFYRGCCAMVHVWFHLLEEFGSSTFVVGSLVGNQGLLSMEICCFCIFVAQFAGVFSLFF